MMTLIARLCALCAVCAFVEMAIPQETARGYCRMIGGMLMLHLVLSGAGGILDEMSSAQGISALFAALVR